jgi:hypothetical protein
VDSVPTTVCAAYTAPDPSLWIGLNITLVVVLDLIDDALLLNNSGTVWLTLLKTTGLKSPPNDAPIGHPPAPSFLDMYDTYKNIIGQRRQELLVFF